MVNGPLARWPVGPVIQYRQEDLKSPRIAEASEYERRIPSNVPVFVAQISDERGQNTWVMQFDEFFCNIELVKEKLRTMKATD